MAGNELSGSEASDPTLYDDALWAITVDEHTEYRRFRAVADMIVNRCGNRLIVLDDATHDRCAALISHMPHVIATAIDQRAGGQPEPQHRGRARSRVLWRDMTRVALTDSELHTCHGGGGRDQRGDLATQHGQPIDVGGQRCRMTWPIPACAPRKAT